VFASEAVDERPRVAAQQAFNAKSEKWQDSDKGIQVRSWVERWEVSLHDVDLELPEPLTEIDPDDHAGRN
jgi:hypothetical protein